MRFSFAYSQRLKTAFNGFFFSGVELYQRQRERATQGENRATEGNGNEENTERPTATAFLRLATVFHGFALLTTPPKSETPTGAKNHGLTAHGLKAADGHELGTETKNATRVNRNSPMRLCARKLLRNCSIEKRPTKTP